jgi:transcriptional regulator with XRE-family HTH domain
MKRRKALTRVLARAFGQVIRDERQRAGLSQERLGFAAHVHPTYISQLERGLKSPSLEVIASLAKALNQKPHALVRAAEERA